jgi:hypothetical protein
MNIGLTKKGDMTDYEWFLLLAENGHCSYQYRLAAEIHAKSLRCDRLVQTYKWLCLASLLGDKRAKDVVDFVYLGMSSNDIDLGNKLLDEWIEDKFESESCRDKSGWSSELKKFLNQESSDS